MATSKSPKSPTEPRRVLPPVDTHDVPQYITYKSALGWMLQNQPMFQKTLHLLKMYPTLADHACMDSFWDCVKDYLTENPDGYRVKNLFMDEKLFERKYYDSSSGKIRRDSDYFEESEDLPRIAVTANTPIRCSYEERVRLTVVGLTSKPSGNSKWNNLVLHLSCNAFVNCIQPDEFERVLPLTSAILFIISDYTLNDERFIRLLDSGTSQNIPIVFVREPGFQIPNCVSYTSNVSPFCAKVLQTRNSLGSLSVPPLGKSGYYMNADEDSLSHGDFRDSSESYASGYNILMKGMKESLVYSGTNTDFCAQTIITDIQESIDRRQRTPSCQSSGNFTFDSPYNDDLQNLSQDDGNQYLRIPSNRKSFSEQSTERNSADDTPKDVSDTESENNKLFDMTPVDRRESIDSETVYILFPVNYRGESTGPPKTIRWPRRRSQDTLDDLEVSSMASELSVGFQDIDLSNPILFDDLPSDEEFKLNVK